MWKKTGRYIPCDYCKKPIYLTPFQEKQSKHHFCSSKCCGNFQKKPMEYQIIDDYAGKLKSIRSYNTTFYKISIKKYIKND